MEQKTGLGFSRKTIKCRYSREKAQGSTKAELAKHIFNIQESPASSDKYWETCPMILFDRCVTHFSAADINISLKGNSMT